MAEQNGTKSAISRRSGRVYMEEHDCSVELSTVGQSQGHSACSSESRYGSGDERGDREKGSRVNKLSSSSSIDGYGDDELIQMVDLGRDLRGLFPTTYDSMGKQGMTSPRVLPYYILTIIVTKLLQEAKNKIERHPPNFGAIVPGAIYRSSFPAEQDYAFLASLELKSVV